MNYRIGLKEVSQQQLTLLEQAKGEHFPPASFAYLERVLNDSDLTSGSEELHPDWLSIYRDIKERDPNFKIQRRLDGMLSQLVESEDVVKKIDIRNKAVAFLLGAGASKPSGIPTVAELLPDLLERGRRLDREDVNRLADYCESSKITNIEDLLTAAQLAEYCGRNPYVMKLMEHLLYRDSGHRPELLARHGSETRVDTSSVAFLQDTLQVLFGLLSSRMLPAKPNAGHEAIASFTKKNPGTSIITTNYDCCIDLALGTDGKDFDYRMPFSNATKCQDQTLPNLIKLHGSLNWFYCESCQTVNLIDISNAIKDYETDDSPYPVIGVCKTCGGQRRGLLVPPLAMKFHVAPALNPLLELANSRLNNANVLVVVGFSFADADLYIARMVSRWMQLRQDNHLVIFDPNAGIADKMRRQLGLRIAGFDRHRVAWVGGDAAAKVPLFLEGKMYSGSRENKDMQGHKTAKAKAS